MRNGFGWLLLASLVSVGCQNAHEIPENLRGNYEMSRLLGTDNVTIAVSANTLTMSECDVNCPELTMRFTSIDCTSESGLAVCTVESEDCTGTIEEGIGTGRSLDVNLTAKPGLTGEAAEQRQVNCYQHSGSLSQS
jgi:hypothetical protein